jgi:hypothetical protein
VGVLVCQAYRITAAQLESLKAGKGNYPALGHQEWLSIAARRLQRSAPSVTRSPQLAVDFVDSALRLRRTLHELICVRMVGPAGTGTDTAGLALRPLLLIHEPLTLFDESIPLRLAAN